MSSFSGLPEARKLILRDKDEGQYERSDGCIGCKYHVCVETMHNSTRITQLHRRTIAREMQELGHHRRVSRSSRWLFA